MRPIAFALEFGQEDIANMLLDKGAAIPVEPGQESYRLFFSACSNGFPRLVNTMLEKGFTIGDDQYARGLPHMAAAGGSATIVEKLIQFGFKMDRMNELGWTPLHAASEKGKQGCRSISAISCLIGAEVSACKGRSARCK